MPTKTKAPSTTKKRTDSTYEAILKPFLQDSDVDFGGTRVNSVEAGLRQDTVFTAIKRIADATARTPLPVFQVLDDDSRNKAKEHPAYRVLNRKANQDQTAFTWKHYSTVHILGWGNSFSLIERDGAGNVIGLNPFHPDDIKIQGRVNTTGELVYAWTDNQQKVHLFPSRDILHIKGLAFDGIVGISPIMHLQSLIGRSRQRDEFLSRFYSNNAQLGGVMRLESGLTEEQLERSRKTFESTYRGAKNAGKILILEGVQEFKESIMSQKDQEFVATSKLDSAKIAAAFGVPLQMLNDIATTTRSSSEQLYLEFLTSCLDTLFTNIESEINIKLFTEEEQTSYYCEFNRQALIQADFSALIEGLSKEVLSVIMTPNEARARLNMNPKEGGDVLLAPVNMVPLEKLGQPQTGSFSPVQQKSTRTHEPPTIKLRSKSGRQRITKSTNILMKDAFSRIATRERKDLQAAIKKQLRTEGDFKTFIKDYYAENSPFVGYMRGILTPIAHATANDIHDDVQTQLGRDVEDDGVEFTNEYVQSLVNRYSLSSRGQIEKILTDLEADEDGAEAVEKRLGEWENGSNSGVNRSRFEIEADQESNRLTNALTRTLFVAAGVTKLVWNTTDDACPICDDLDGKTVGIEDSFVSDGDELPNNFKASSDYLHPPLHSGCSCEVNPGD